MSSILHPRVNLVMQRSMELDNSEYDVSRLIKLVKMAGGNKVFRELLEDIKTLKSISPSMIDKAANMLNE